MPIRQLSRVIDSGLVGRKVPRREKMLHSRTDSESYITEYTAVYEEEENWSRQIRGPKETDLRGNRESGRP